MTTPSPSCRPPPRPSASVSGAPRWRPRCPPTTRRRTCARACSGSALYSRCTPSSGARSTACRPSSRPSATRCVTEWTPTSTTTRWRKSSTPSVTPECRRLGPRFAVVTIRYRTAISKVRQSETLPGLGSCAEKPPVRLTSLNIHTYTRLTALCRDYRVSRYQKGKTNLDFTEATDNEWQWHQLGHMQVCTLLQAYNHASTPPLSFLQAGCPSCRPTNSVKALKHP